MDLYTEAAAVLDRFENKQGSVKNLVFASGYKNIRQLYALACESLKYRPVLMAIWEKCRSLQQEADLQGQGHLYTVLLYEHLIGKGLGRAGQIRKCIIKHKSEIREKCAELLEERGVSSLGDLLSSQCQTLNKLPIPRYVRVNLLNTTVDEVVTTFTVDGWRWRGMLGLDTFRSDVEGLGEDGFGQDPLLQDLLIFPPGTDLHDHPGVLAGSLVLQDRASCFPAHVLSPEHGAAVLDCCAAPGNKTSHAASLMGNTGRILAYERDGKRVGLLQQQLRKLGVSNVTTYHRDFLSVDPRDPRFADVEYILVDPSCSGSGMMSRMDHVNTTTGTPASGDDAGRLASLQRFQISILKHALRFPHARRIVYSTCSIHQEENEKVVGEVALQVKDRFEVKAIFPRFSHRGSGCEEGAEKCLRMSPELDLTNGFFVACFERVSSSGDGDEALESVKARNMCEVESGNVPEETRNDTVAAPPPQKKKKKKKEGGERKDVLSEFSPSKGNFSLHERQRGTMDDDNLKGIEKVSPQKKMKKNKKRKRKEETGSEEAASGVSCSGSSTSLLLNGQQEVELDQSPKVKKKTKKKCKHKKKQDQRGDCDVTSSGLQETQVGSSIPELSSFDTMPCCPEKLRSSRSGRKGDWIDPSVPVQGYHVSLHVSTADTDTGEDVPEKGKKRKKDKELAEEDRSSACLQTDESGPSTKKKKKGKRAEDNDSLHIHNNDGDPPAKKRKRDKTPAEDDSSFSSFDFHLPKSELPVLGSVSEMEVSAKTKRKKRKKKHPLQE